MQKINFMDACFTVYNIDLVLRQNYESQNYIEIHNQRIKNKKKYVCYRFANMADHLLIAMLLNLR